jgi:hypothetical protein
MSGWRQLALAGVGLAAACSTPPGELAADGTPADGGADDAADLRPDAEPALRLSEVGLYADGAAGELVPEALAYRPAFPFWSDGGDKQRWLILPPGSAVDSSDMDHWRLPVGAKLFKEFVVDGVRVETRLIWRRGVADYFMGAFVWLPDQSDALFTAEGAEDALGTAHDVPRAVQCAYCHDGEAGRVLGLSAIQLSHDGDGLTLGAMAAAGLLSDPPAAGTAFPVPGEPTVQAALGYLHANCGHCHNPAGPAFADVDLVLRLAVAERTPEATALYASTIDAALQRWVVEPYQVRVAPGQPEASALLARMRRRGGIDQMPPLGSEQVDLAGSAAVEAWIGALSAAPP